MEHSHSYNMETFTRRQQNVNDYKKNGDVETGVVDGDDVPFDCHASAIEMDLSDHHQMISNRVAVRHEQNQLEQDDDEDLDAIFDEIYLEDERRRHADYPHHQEQEQQQQRAMAERRTTAMNALQELGHSLTHSFSEIVERARSFGSNKHLKRRGVGGRGEEEDDDEPPELKKSDSDGEISNTSGTDSNTSTSVSSTEDVESPATTTEPVIIIPNHKRGRSRTTRRERRKASASSGRHLSTSKHPLEDDEHISWFAHGFIWTVIGIVFSWTGFALAFMARSSTSFVTLDSPLYVDPVFDPVEEVGMMNLRLCFNETYLYDDDGRGQQEKNHEDMGCTIHQLNTADVNDVMFQVSRTLLSLVVLVGGFMSIFLTAASFWKSINLRPIGIGYLVSYFLQSFSFLFFDTNLCAEYTCHISTGCKYSIIASLCWIVACVASSRMDVYKMDQKEKKRKLLRRLRRQETSLTQQTSKHRESEEEEEVKDVISIAIDIGSHTTTSRSPSKRMKSSRSPSKRSSTKSSRSPSKRSTTKSSRSPSKRSSTKSSRSPSKRSTTKSSRSPSKRDRRAAGGETMMNYHQDDDDISVELIDGIQDQEAQRAWIERTGGRNKSTSQRRQDWDHSLECVRQEETKPTTTCSSSSSAGNGRTLTSKNKMNEPKCRSSNKQRRSRSRSTSRARVSNK